MILVDTSVWIDHLRERDEKLGHLLDAGRVAGHPFVIGEIALGNLTQRGRILRLLANLPKAPIVATGDALSFMDLHDLSGCGIGYVDLHLLASAASLGLASLWTRDKRLMKAADRIGLLADA